MRVDSIGTRLKLIPDPEQREAKINEIRNTVCQLEKELAANVINSNKNASLEEFEQAIEAWMQDKDTYVSEQGDIENWQGGDKTKIYEEIKQKIEELKRTDIY